MKKILLLPKTRPGKWSTGLIIIFFLLLAILRVLVVLGQRGGETFFSNLILAIPALMMGASGVSAFFTGAAAIAVKKERSFFVFLSTLIGLLILFLFLGKF